MIGILVKKEIRNHVLSFRFLVTFVLLLVIVPVTTLILTNDYIRKQDDYSRRQAEIQNYLSRYAHFNRIGNVIEPSQPPIPFMTFVRGLSADVNMGAFDNDPLPVMFPLLDLTFIVAILLSLTALIFAYDSVSGEKEDGTLKLMLANGLARSNIILGKIAGGLATLLIPFLISLAVGLIIILLNPRIGWKGSDWGALGMIVAGTVVYFALFTCLGIFISSRHQSSSSSIMTSLFVWVLFVLVVPNLSPYLASLIRPTPSRIMINREVNRITQDERDKLGSKIQKEKTAEVIKSNPALAPFPGMSQKDIQDAIKKDPAFGRAYEVLTSAIEAAWREANRIQGDKARILTEDLDRKEQAQTRLSVILSLISPLADFSFLTTDLSNTGMRNEVHFRTVRSAWDQAFGDYADNKMEELRKKDPTMDVWNTPVDVSDMPRFQYREEALTGRIKGVLAPFTILIVVSIVLFSAAYVSFIRYDVR